MKFWKSWQSLHGKKQIGARVNGKTDNSDIANDFATNFKKIYDEADSDQARRLATKFDSAFIDYLRLHENIRTYNNARNKR